MLSRRISGQGNTSVLRVCALLALASTPVACGGPSAQQTARAEALFGTCATCHGDHAQGNRETSAPGLAGLPEWYIQLQLWEFQVGFRAYVPADSTGKLMAAAAGTLTDPEDAKALAAWLADQPVDPSSPTLGGDVAKGKVAYQACIICHERDGSGRVDKTAPPIAGMADWYVAGQLRKFRDGWRGTNPKDVPGSTMMRPVSIPLSDHDIVNLAAYVATLK